jgi:hypothetical protein
VPHPLYRPTKSKLVPCVDQLCASLHGALNGKHRCKSAQQQCDYEIRYADQASSIGVLINDNFALRLANTSVVRPSLAFGYATCILLGVQLCKMSGLSWPLMIPSICTGVGMTNRLPAVKWHPPMVCLVLGADQLACFHSSSSMGSPRMWLVTASAQEEGVSSSLGIILCLTHMQHGLPWLEVHSGECYYYC